MLKVIAKLLVLWVVAMALASVVVGVLHLGPFAEFICGAIFGWIAFKVAYNRWLRPELERRGLL